MKTTRSNLQVSKILYLFLFTAVLAILTLGISTNSQAQKKMSAEDLGKAASTLININTADQKTLESLPGVGKSTAKAIIAGRPYKSIDDLKRVKGMSDKKINAIRDQITVGSAAATAAPAAQKKKGVEDLGKAASGLIDVNTADQKTLESLPGVGKSTAKAIIAGRPYKSIDDLKRVKGMSDKKINAIKDQITVGAAAATAAPAAIPSAAGMSEKASSATKEMTGSAQKSKSKLAPGQLININTAPKEELDLLPGIGPVKAQAIIDGRPYNSPEDIMKVKGIKQKTYDKIKDMITVR